MVDKQTLDKLASQIVSLNIVKDNYALKKIKKEHKETEEREMIASLIEIIALLREIAFQLGISDDGKINRTDETYLEAFKQLNNNVNLLKSNIRYIIDTSSDDLKIRAREETDKIALIKKNSKNEHKIRDRLKSTLETKKNE